MTDQPDRQDGDGLSRDQVIEYVRELNECAVEFDIVNKKLSARNLRRIADRWFKSLPTRDGAEGAECILEHALEATSICRSSPPKPAPDAMGEAKRYRRLQVIGCAPDGTQHLENRTVLRFSNLDAFLDADIEAYSSRGDVPLSEPVPPADGIMEATRQQHVGRPKGEPAQFVRNGKLETCTCFDCRAIPPSPAVAAEPIARDNRHCPDGSDHGNCLYPDCVSSCPGRPPVRGDRELLEQCAKIAQQFELDMSNSVLDDRDIELIKRGANEASAAIETAILSLPVQSGAGEREWQWLPIEHRPLVSGKYLVGHRGTQEIMHFFGPEKNWVRGTQLGWQRFTDKGWIPDNPAMRFNATHCCLIELPSDSRSEPITKEAAEAATKRAT